MAVHEGKEETAFTSSSSSHPKWAITTKHWSWTAPEHRAAFCYRCSKTIPTDQNKFIVKIHNYLYG